MDSAEIRSRVCGARRLERISHCWYITRSLESHIKADIETGGFPPDYPNFGAI